MQLDNTMLVLKYFGAKKINNYKCKKTLFHKHLFLLFSLIKHVVREAVTSKDGVGKINYAKQQQ